MLSALLLYQASTVRTYSEVIMGLRVDLTFSCVDVSLAESAARSAFDAMHAVDAVASDYRRDSELSRLCDQAGNGFVPVSPELFLLLSRSRSVSSLSDGAFDVTAGPVIRLWREARTTGKMPSWPALRSARSLVGWDKVLLDNGRVFLPTGYRIDLGGIAKGYAVDQGFMALRRRGIRMASVVAGGDLRVGDPLPGSLGWSVRVAVESSPRLLKNVAVSTSGDAEQFALIRGVRYSHIVDPRTGFGLTNRVQATVIGRDGLTTDPIATALCVLGEPGVKKLSREYPFKASFLVRTD